MAADRLTIALLVLIVAVGILVRFWGLGNVGLHGDEKTMALPAMHLLQYGTPEMPSGFTYPRAMAQLYLMAGSALAFGGPSEWTFRLPSAICGVLLIVLTWIAGRRFLEPRWNLALTAAVALLPAFIQDAQTARMYVFLVTGVAGFMALLFAWERTGRSGYLLGAVLEMAVSLEFHTLSIFAAWLCFLPGLVSGERRKLWQGTVAFAAIAVEFVALNHWISTQYPHALGALAGTPANAPRAVATPLQSAMAPCDGTPGARVLVVRDPRAGSAAGAPAGRKPGGAGITPRPRSDLFSSLPLWCSRAATAGCPQGDSLYISPRAYCLQPRSSSTCMRTGRERHRKSQVSCSAGRACACT